MSLKSKIVAKLDLVKAISPPFQDPMKPFKTKQKFLKIPVSVKTAPQKNLKFETGLQREVCPRCSDRMMKVRLRSFGSRAKSSLPNSEYVSYCKRCRIVLPNV